MQDGMKARPIPDRSEPTPEQIVAAKVLRAVDGLAPQEQMMLAQALTPQLAEVLRRVFGPAFEPLIARAAKANARMTAPPMAPADPFAAMMTGGGQPPPMMPAMGG